MALSARSGFKQRHFPALCLGAWGTAVKLALRKGTGRNRQKISRLAGVLVHDEAASKILRRRKKTKQWKMVVRALHRSEKYNEELQAKWQIDRECTHHKLGINL